MVRHQCILLGAPRCGTTHHVCSMIDWHCPLPLAPGRLLPMQPSLRTSCTRGLRVQQGARMHSHNQQRTSGCCSLSGSSSCKHRLLTLLHLLCQPSSVAQQRSAFRGPAVPAAAPVQQLAPLMLRPPGSQHWVHWRPHLAALAMGVGCCSHRITASPCCHKPSHPLSCRRGRRVAAWGLASCSWSPHQAAAAV